MIREKIQAELDRQGWSVLRLSKETGIRKSSLDAFLNGTQEMYSGNIVKCLKALKLNIAGNYTKYNKAFFEKLEPSQLDQELAALVLAIAYRKQEMQTVLLDIRPYEYRAKNKRMIKVDQLIRAIYPENIGELEKAAISVLADVGSVEIGIKFVTGLLLMK